MGIAGLALDQCRHLVFSDTHLRNALLLCKEAGVKKVHSWGAKHVPDLLQKLDIRTKPVVKAYNNEEPLVNGKEEDHYGAIMAHLITEATRTMRVRLQIQLLVRWSIRSETRLQGCRQTCH
jgi:hypothetical protein